MQSEAENAAQHNGTAHAPRVIDADKAERAALRGILSDNSDMLDDALRYLNPSNFQNPEYRVIAEAVWTCHYRHSKRDAEAVEAFLLSEKETEAAAALNALILPMPQPSRAEFHDAAHTVQNYKLTAQSQTNPFTANMRGLAEIFKRPRPLWIVEGLLLEFGYSAFTGGYGTFKSFALLDMGLCIAVGKQYHGRNVKQGTVVYVVAEGAYTTADRAKAWLIRHQLDAPENFHVIEIPAQIGEAAICEMFIAAIVELQPVFVVLDTLSKCNVGADENSSCDMGLFTHGMQEVATRLKCQVIAVHHNGKNGDARGSNALPSNVDTHITAKATAGNVITIECEKTKVAPFEKFSLIGRVVELGERDEYGHEVTSLVFEPTDTPEKPNQPTAKERQCLEVLQSHGATSEEWFNLARAQDVSKPTFYRCRDSLRDKKEVFLSTKTGLYHPKSQSLTQSQ